MYSTEQFIHLNLGNGFHLPVTLLIAPLFSGSQDSLGAHILNFIIEFFRKHAFVVFLVIIESFKTVNEHSALSIDWALALERTNEKESDEN